MSSTTHPQKLATKIFISHAVHDKKLADELVNLIRLGVGFHESEVFCSSVPGSIPSGVNFVEFIKDRLGGASAVISLITQSYYDSAFCMAEYGGTWLTGKDAYPVVVPPLSFSSLPIMSKVMQATDLNDKAALSTLREALQPLSTQPSSDASWEAKRDVFLEKWKSYINRYHGPVTKAKFDRAVSQKKTAMDKAQGLVATVAEKDQEIEKLRNQIAQFKSTRPVAQVAKIIAGNSSSDFEEAFDDLVRPVKKAMGELGKVMNPVMFQAFQGSPYKLKDYENPDDFEDLKDRQIIYFNDDSDTWSVNEEDAEVQVVQDALSALESFLDEAPEGFAEWYQSQYKLQKPTLKNKGFWERHLYA